MDPRNPQQPPFSRDRPKAAAASSPAAENIETLFYCSSCRIVSFSCSAPTADRRSSLPTSATGEGLPWKYPNERTIASGVLQIYSVANSVSFLNAGSLLLPILPKSQCWCVDGESKFVLRKGQTNFYRIELPHKTDEDKNLIEDFKRVLGKVLQFEKTLCPFRSGYSEEVESPEPVRKHRRHPPERAKKWKFDRKWRPEGAENISDISEGSGPSASEDDDTISVTSSNRDESPRPKEVMLPERGRSSTVGGSMLGVVERTKKLFANKSFAEAQELSAAAALNAKMEPGSPLSEPVLMQPKRRSTVSSSVDVGSSKKLSIGPGRLPTVTSLELRPSPSTGLPQASILREDESLLSLETPRAPGFPVSHDSEDERSPNVDEPRPLVHSASIDSFYSMATAGEGPRSPSIVDTESIYEDPLPELENLEIYSAGHKRGPSEITITPNMNVDGPAEDTPRASRPRIRIGSEPTTPTLISDSEESFELTPDVTTPPDSIRLRKLTGASQRRAYSPMPHPANLVSTTRARSQTRLLASTIVQKTCALLLSPPSSLVELMLKIAARIAAGFGVHSYRLDRRHRVPGSWESAEEEDEWDEDDYGIPLQYVGSRDSSVASTNRLAEATEG